MEHDSLQQPLPYLETPSVASDGTEPVLTDYEQGYAAGVGETEAKYQESIDAATRYLTAVRLWFTTPDSVDEELKVAELQLDLALRQLGEVKP